MNNFLKNILLPVSIIFFALNPSVHTSDVPCEDLNTDALKIYEEMQEHSLPIVGTLKKKKIKDHLSEQNLFQKYHTALLAFQIVNKSGLAYPDESEEKKSLLFFIDYLTKQLSQDKTNLSLVKTCQDLTPQSDLTPCIDFIKSLKSSHQNVSWVDQKIASLKDEIIKKNREWNLILKSPTVKNKFIKPMGLLLKKMEKQKCKEQLASFAKTPDISTCLTPETSTAKKFVDNMGSIIEASTYHSDEENLTRLIEQPDSVLKNTATAKHVKADNQKEKIDKKISKSASVPAFNHALGGLAMGILPGVMNPLNLYFQNQYQLGFASLNAESMIWSQHFQRVGGSSMNFSPGGMGFNLGF